LRFALQRLIAVGAIKFKFVRVHKLHLHHAQSRCEKYMKIYSYFLQAECACRVE
jgi:hypothetical protein